jgi:hypothetical protein
MKRQMAAFAIVLGALFSQNLLADAWSVGGQSQILSVPNLQTLQRKNSHYLLMQVEAIAKSLPFDCDDRQTINGNSSSGVADGFIYASAYVDGRQVCADGNCSTPKILVSEFNGQFCQSTAKARLIAQLGLPMELLVQDSKSDRRIDVQLFYRKRSSAFDGKDDIQVGNATIESIRMLKKGQLGPILIKDSSRATIGDVKVAEVIGFHSK